MDELLKACEKGNTDSKRAIESLAPEMAETLKKKKEWDSPQLSIENLIPDSVSVFRSGEGVNSLPTSVHDSLIEAVLPACDDTAREVLACEEDTAEAYANLIIDTDINHRESDTSSEHDTPSESRQDTHVLLKALQPYREKPSKDLSKRFAAGEIALDKAIPSEHDVATQQIWTIFPTNPLMRKAKVFLLGQIIYISESDKPVRSSMKCNPTTHVVLTVYEYTPETIIFAAAGRSWLLKAANTLLANVSNHVSTESGGQLQFDCNEISELVDYIPFHPDIDIQGRLPEDADPSTSNASIMAESEDPYIVENIVSKRFNSIKGQYEYLVKWQGYTSQENTWELLSNIPGSILESYESKLLGSSTSSDRTPRRSGLRDKSTRKILHKSDYIVNK